MRHENRTPDEAATTKQSHNNPSHLVTHPLHRKARQDKAGRNPGSTHIHARTTHHQYMWACGITKIESCRSWVPYMRSSPPAASVAASRWRGHGMDRRQTPPCTWACNIKTGQSLPTAFNSIRFLNRNVFPAYHAHSSQGGQGRGTSRSSF